MKTDAPETESSLVLTSASYHILLSLAEGEKHGYAIMLDVASITDGQLRMGPGTLYGALKRLLEAGLIRESAARPDPALDDERRRYYALTPDGRRVLGVEAERMVKWVRVARRRKVFSPLAPQAYPRHT